MTTRALVMEKREDGSSHVLSLRTVGWEIYDMPPRQETPEELTDEIGLMLADAGIGPEPLISLDGDGRLHHLIWPDEIEKLAQTLMLALAPEIRRARRARRSARASKSQGAAVAKSERAVVEVAQGRDGRWRRAPDGEHLVVAASALAAVAEHARQVEAARPGFESWGALVLGDDDGRVVRYTRLHNPATSPGHVSIRHPGQLARRPDGLGLLACHSHPPGASTAPSRTDLAAAIQFGWETFAIYSPRDDLRFFRPLPDGGFREVASVID